MSSSKPSPRQIPCRSCGRPIVCNDKTLTISHEVPECDGFLALFAGPSIRAVEVIDMTDIPVAGPVKPG